MFLAKTTKSQKFNKKNKTSKGKKMNCMLIKMKMRKMIENFRNLQIGVNYTFETQRLGERRHG